MCHCERSDAISRDCHVASLLAGSFTIALSKSYLIPLCPPLSKGGDVSPPFSKGRLGGILQDDFKQLN